LVADVVVVIGVVGEFDIDGRGILVA